MPTGPNGPFPASSIPLEDKAMSIISKLLTLGLAAALSSTGPQRQIDFNMPGPDGQRINQLWLVTYINETGLEVVAQAKLRSGDYAPMIAADPARLESMLPAAHDLATTRNIKMRLIKLTNRVDIEEIVP
jgi:hypothetical protein